MIVVSALIPAFCIASIFYFLDDNREPMKAVIWAFLLGIVSVFLLIPVIVFDPFTKPAQDGDLVNSLVLSFYHAGFLEELSKFTVFMVGIYAHKAFHEWYDGILYGVMIGLGFAFFENVEYFRRFLEDMGNQIIIVRSLLSMPLHALIGGVMGFYLGKARFTPDRRKVPVFIAMGLLVPIFVHGLYDFVASYMVYLKLLVFPFVVILWSKVLEMKRMAQSNQPSVISRQQASTCGCLKGE